MSEEDDFYYEDEEEELCPEGFSRDECCGCVGKMGVETCELACPFRDIRFENCPYWKECLEELEKEVEEK